MSELWRLCLTGCGSSGSAADMRDMAGTLDKIAGSMVRGYAVKSGKPDEDIAALMAAETWFDAVEALEAGLATRVLEPVRIAASFDIARAARTGRSGGGCRAGGRRSNRGRHRWRRLRC